MRGTIKIIIVLLTLLVIGFNVLQCAGIGKAVGSAASATDEKAMQVRGLREQLEKIVKDRNLVRQFEPAAAKSRRTRPGEESGGNGPQGGSSGGDGSESTTLSGGSGGRMVWATTEGVVDAEATAVSDKLDREQLVAAGAVVGTGVATVAGGLFSGGLLCVSVGIYIPVVLVLVLVLMLTRGSGGRAARAAAAGNGGGDPRDQRGGGARIPVANAADEDFDR